MTSTLACHASSPTLPDKSIPIPLWDLSQLLMWPMSKVGPFGIWLSRLSVSSSPKHFPFHLYFDWQLISNSSFQPLFHGKHLLPFLLLPSVHTVYPEENNMNVSERKQHETIRFGTLSRENYLIGFVFHNSIKMLQICILFNEFDCLIKCKHEVHVSVTKFY